MESGQNKWVEQALNSLEGINTAVPPKGLPGRIMQRLQAERFRMLPATVSNTAIYRAAAAILLIVTINVFACINYNKISTERKGMQGIANSLLMQGNDEELVNM